MAAGWGQTLRDTTSFCTSSTAVLIYAGDTLWSQLPWGYSVERLFCFLCIFWMISTSALVLSDPVGTRYLLDVTTKDKVFWLFGFYGPNVSSELLAFFQHIRLYLISLKWVIFVGDWNAILDRNLDRGAISAGTNTLDVRYFRKFVERYDLVDKFCERHPNKLAWTWTGWGASAQLYSYLNWVLAR